MGTSDRHPVSQIPKLMLKKRGGVFLIFVLISTTIWFLNTLNDTHSTSVSLPLKVINIPVDAEVTYELPAHLDVTVTGRGFDLIGLHITKSRDSVILDVAEIVAVDRSKRRYALSTLKLISGEWGAEGGLNPLVAIPDSLVIDLAERSSKLLPVSHDISITPENSFGIRGGIIIKPDSIIVNGNINSLKNLSHIQTEKIELTEVTGEIFNAVLLKNPDKTRFTLSTPYVWYYCKIDEFTEARFNTIVNLPVQQRAQVKLIPSEVSISFVVPVNMFSEIGPEDFRLETFLPEGPPYPSSLEVRVTKSPEGIRKLKVEPRLLDYLVTDK